METLPTRTLRLKYSPSCGHVRCPWFKIPPAPTFSIGQQVRSTANRISSGYIVGHYFAQDDPEEDCILLGWNYVVYFNKLVGDIDYPDRTPINSPLRLLILTEDEIEAIA